jgi:hypothetical protein
MLLAQHFRCQALVKPEFHAKDQREINATGFVANLVKVAIKIVFKQLERIKTLFLRFDLCTGKMNPELAKLGECLLVVEALPACP